MIVGDRECAWHQRPSRCDHCWCRRRSWLTVAGHRPALSYLGDELPKSVSSAKSVRCRMPLLECAVSQVAHDSSYGSGASDW